VLSVIWNPKFGPLISPPFLVGSFPNFQGWKTGSSIPHLKIPQNCFRFPLICRTKLGFGAPKPPEMGFLGQRYAETIPWAKVEFWWILRKIVKNINNRQREAQKLEIALALALGMCIHSHSALVPAVPAENVGIPREDDFSHLFQWRRSSLRESLCALGEPGENGKTDTPSLLLLTLLLQRCSWWWDSSQNKPTHLSSWILSYLFDGHDELRGSACLLFTANGFVNGR